MIPFDEINDAILVTLTPKEEMVLRRYYGLRCPKEPVRNIAHYWKVTSGRMYQVIKKALRKVEVRFSTDLGYPPR
jgi:DNA-directed RNA polymerase sigma subunit (sigma70/sigma32)